MPVLESTHEPRRSPAYVTGASVQPPFPQDQLAAPPSHLALAVPDKKAEDSLARPSAKNEPLTVKAVPPVVGTRMESYKQRLGQGLAADLRAYIRRIAGDDGVDAVVWLRRVSEVFRRAKVSYVSDKTDLLDTVKQTKKTLDVETRSCGPEVRRAYDMLVSYAEELNRASTSIVAGRVSDMARSLVAKGGQHAVIMRNEPALEQSMNEAIGSEFENIVVKGNGELDWLDDLTAEVNDGGKVWIILGDYTTTMPGARVVPKLDSIVFAKGIGRQSRDRIVKMFQRIAQKRVLWQQVDFEAEEINISS